MPSLRGPTRRQNPWPTKGSLHPKDLYSACHAEDPTLLHLS
ncbi:unnamed protein product [Prunus brigantina]